MQEAKGTKQLETEPMSLDSLFGKLPQPQIGYW